MMPEISLNILDVAQNSVTAGASLVHIDIKAETLADLLTVSISDNGKGMSEEQVKNVTNPFYTTRTTRKVGLGVPFFKMAAEITGGSFNIQSELGVGTTTTAAFKTSSIDRMPLGDIAGTMTGLIGPSPDIDFLLTVSVDEKEMAMDTREFRQVLGEDVPLSAPEVLAYIDEYIRSGMTEIGADSL